MGLERWADWAPGPLDVELRALVVGHVPLSAMTSAARRVLCALVSSASF